jgi:hypothetical protein
MRENIERADRVLLVFTETYARRFLGKEAPGKCGDLPLALAMIGAMVRMDPRPTAWRDVLARLRRADLAAIKVEIADYPYPNLLRTIEVSVEGLESADRERYFDLAVFPEDQPVPESALSVLWKLDAIDTRGCMARLATSSLAGWAMGDRAFQISAGVPHR